MPIDGYDGTLLWWLLKEMETVHARVRRYQSPDELAFTFKPVNPHGNPLPPTIIKPLEYPKLLHKTVNYNAKIYEHYVRDIVPKIAAPGADRGETQEHYGSTATRDMECLQSISRRIHLGQFVAEAKYLSDPEGMGQMIRERDVAGLENAITNKAVEEQVLNRLRKKALYYGRDPDSEVTHSSMRVDVEAVVNIYKVSMVGELVSSR